MLILTRRVGETMMISDDITVEILGVKGGQIRLGIIAPRHISIHRSEIYKRIQEEKQRQQEEEKNCTDNTPIYIEAISGSEAM